MKEPQRTVAIDWSGAKTGSEKKIWLAEVDASGLRTLENGKSREEVRDRLIEMRDEDPNFVVGLDFAFSFPAWFVREDGCSTTPEFWEYVRSHGENWVSGLLEEPFFTKGKGKQADRQLYRETDWALKEEKDKPSPETVFKLVGAKQVGYGSIRGMPILADLRGAGFSIWPFDPPQLPMVVEIYPRLFYEGVIKSSEESRLNFLKNYPDLTELQRAHAQCSDDAFDAAVSALKMYEEKHRFASPPTTKGEEKIEGRIWQPQPLSTGAT